MYAALHRQSGQPSQFLESIHGASDSRRVSSNLDLIRGVSIAFNGHHPIERDPKNGLSYRHANRASKNG
jgi:hypothetical protein